MNLFIKKKTGVMLVAAAICAIAAVGTLVTFQSAQAEETPMTASEALDALAESVSISDKEITFTIPGAYEKSDDWRIQVSGRYRMGKDETMSVHLLDNDGIAGRWRGEKGFTPSLSLTTTWTSLKTSPYGPSFSMRMVWRWNGRWICWRSAGGY